MNRRQSDRTQPTEIELITLEIRTSLEVDEAINLGKMKEYSHFSGQQGVK